jgi:hypothetical protein
VDRLTPTRTLAVSDHQAAILRAALDRRTRAERELQLVFAALVAAAGVTDASLLGVRGEPGRQQVVFRVLEPPAQLAASASENGGP